MPPQTDRSRNGENSLHRSRRRSRRTFHLDQNVPLSHTAAEKPEHGSGAAAPRQVKESSDVSTLVDLLPMVQPEEADGKFQTCRASTVAEINYHQEIQKIFTICRTRRCYELWSRTGGKDGLLPYQGDQVRGHCSYCEPSSGASDAPNAPPTLFQLRRQRRWKERPERLEVPVGQWSTWYHRPPAGPGCSDDGP